MTELGVKEKPEDWQTLENKLSAIASSPSDGLYLHCATINSLSLDGVEITKMLFQILKGERLLHILI